ncbi:MAG: hypothetical protein SFU98_06660 [Leptospiraceae bacterium]|nr:hypothetical protein [Leptospiraceae bacterium]
MLDFIKNLFSSSEDDEQKQINEIADRIERFKDRFENSGEEENAQFAMNYATRARKMKRVVDALRVEKEFFELLRKRGVNLVKENETDDNYNYGSTRTIYYDNTNRSDSILYGSSELIDETRQPEESIQSGDGEFSGAGASESYSDNS